MVIFFSFLILCFVLSSGSTEVFAIEKKALDIYNSISRMFWNIAWDLSSPVSSWSGIGIKDKKNISRALFNKNHKVIQPNSIDQFSNTQKLNLTFKCKEGTIPIDNFRLRNLSVLRLGKNFLSGSVSKNLKKRDRLEVIDLFNNSLISEANDILGKFPKNIISLSKHELLLLKNNILIRHLFFERKKLKRVLD